VTDDTLDIPEQSPRSGWVPMIIEPIEIKDLERVGKHGIC